MEEATGTFIDLLSKEELNYAQIETHLFKLNLPPHPPERLLEEWALKNEKNSSIFETACERNDKKLFEILLDFDFPIPIQYSEDGLDEEIACLLRTRGIWQREVLAGEDGISFNRASALIEMALKEITAEASEAILVMGLTNVGKSTLTNFIGGVDYLRKGVKIIKKNDQQKEIAKVGNNTWSETLFPTTYKVDALKEKILWVDMPGLEDTRGIILEIASAVGTSVLANGVKKIKGIVLVCPWSQLEDLKLLEYRKAAANVGRIVDGKKILLDHIILIVSKPPAELAVEDVVENLKKLWDGELKNLKVEVANADGSSQKKLDVKNVTQVFLGESDISSSVKTKKPKIIIADVTNAQHREDILKAVDEFPEAKDQGEFNFKNYHVLVERFKKKIDYFNNKYQNLINNVDSLQSELGVLKDKKEAVNAQLEQHVRLKDNWLRKREKLNGGLDIEDRIKRNREIKESLMWEINKIKENMARLTTPLRHMRQSAETIKRRIAVINSDIYDSSGLSAMTQSVREKEGFLLNYYEQLIGTYEAALRTTEKSLNVKYEQLAVCEKNESLLKEEKIEIEAIKQEVESNIEEHLEEQDTLINKSKRELEFLIESAKEKQSTLNECMLELKVNESFFRKISDLIKKLGWRSHINFTFRTGNGPLFFSSGENRQEMLPTFVSVEKEESLGLRK